MNPSLALKGKTEENSRHWVTSNLKGKFIEQLPQVILNKSETNDQIKFLSLRVETKWWRQYH